MKRSTRRRLEQALAFFSIGMVAGAAFNLARENPADIDFRQRAVLGGFGLLAVVALFQHVRRADELEKRIHSIAMNTSFLGTALATLVYGLMQTAGFPLLSWIWVFLMLVTLAMLGGTAASLWYRR